jgi:hypothetical protein
MKRILIILIIVNANSIAISQDTLIYRQSFSDSSIVRVIEEIGLPKPENLSILNKTMLWKPYRFYMVEVLGLSNIELSKIHFDEHHPFEHSYIFNDTTLNSLFPDSLKLELRNNSLSLKPTKVTIRGSGYHSVANMDNKTGYYVRTTQPVYCSQSRYAFIEFDICYKEKLIPDNNFNFEQIVNFLYVFKLQNDGSWKIIWRLKHVYG